MPLNTPREQVILVTAASYRTIKATLRAYEGSAGQFHPVSLPMPAVLGRNGLAPPGSKTEGDGRTPSGTFRLVYAFGYQPQVQTNMPYRQATDEDFWVDDPNSPQYNQWVRDKAQANSYERMRRDDDQYAYGVVIDYNSERIPWLGSAIFLHVWAGPESPTAGCVAVSKEHMKALLGWLNPAYRPVITIGLENNDPVR